ncbi:NUDIX hydrolase [Novosphingobium sp. KA1]|uniref:NUDIX hydrolase n=1 Tax=Novosphingobium sp. (strain KA1) TaxID=164608 RepID=UPI00351C31C1
MPAAIAVVLKDDTVLLVRRANPPDAGKWGFPGGKIDAGESIAAATERELAEETGVTARSICVLTALDAVDRDDDDHVRHHYILVASLCRWISGEPVAADDALEASWIRIADLDQMTSELSADVAEVARLAQRISHEQRPCDTPPD